MQIREEFTGKLQQTEDANKARDLQQQANEKMLGVIEENNISIEEYNAINEAVQTDPELRNRVIAMMQCRGCQSSSPGRSEPRPADAGGLLGFDNDNLIRHASTAACFEKRWAEVRRRSPPVQSLPEGKVVFEHPLWRLDLRVVTDALQQHGVGRGNQPAVAATMCAPEIGSAAPSITRIGTSPRCMAATHRSRCATRSGM